MWFQKPRSAVAVQMWFCVVFGREPATKMTIYKWYKLFVETGCICKGKTLGDSKSLKFRWTQFMHLLFTHSPSKSTRHAAWQTCHTQQYITFFWKWLEFKCYKQLQHVTAQDREVCCIFCFWPSFKTWRWWTFYSQNCLQWWSHTTFIRKW